MTRVDLTRYYTPGEQGTFGELSVDGTFACYTIERPWRGNEPMISCIPEGVYPLARSRFHRGGYDTWEVRAVEGRSRILFHVANRASELLGCIAPGRGLGVVGGQWAVTASASAFADLMDQLSGAEEAVLRIGRFDPAMGG